LHAASFITVALNLENSPLGIMAWGRGVISKDFSQFLEPFELLLCFSSIKTLC